MLRRVEPAPESSETTPSRRRTELLMFLFLTVVLWPAVAVAVVGSYGFGVWMYQLIAGPPGPPPT